MATLEKIERLSFVTETAQYDTIFVAEHYSRYLSVKSLCKGKSVLDAACGEGYGAKLLAEWGASNVVGVDNSAEAISRAKQYYSGSSIRYIVGDLQNPDSNIVGNKKFDVICSFETIEHLENPVAFLNNLKKWRKRDGTILLSAPNDPVFAADHPNPFHKRQYTLESLKSLIEPILGRASDWYCGTAAQGICLRNIATIALQEHPPKFSALSFDSSQIAWIPPVASNSVSEHNCAFWVGVWGEAALEDLVVSPLSMTSFLSPWKALDWLKKDNAELSRQLRQANLTIAEERRVALNDRKLMSELNTVLDDEIQRRGIKFDKGLAISDKARQILAQGVLSRLFNRVKAAILRLVGR